MYSNVQKPWELPDDVVLNSTETEAAARLSPDGWDSQKVISSVSWIRLRSITGEIAETVLKFRFSSTSEKAAMELKQVVGSILPTVHAR